VITMNVETVKLVNVEDWLSEAVEVKGAED
jgi:hypothetical protein